MSFLFTNLLKTLAPSPKGKRRGKRRVVKRPPERDPFAAPTHFFLHGENLPLIVTQCTEEPHSCVSTAGALHLNIPTPDLSPASLAAEAGLSLKLWVKRETKTCFAERLAFWSGQLGVTPRRLVVTSPRARWGSCTSDNEIRLSWRLIQLPPALMDYVVAHEVCHIPHKNHGPGFWRELERLIPDCKERRHQLRAFEKGGEIFVAA